MSYVILAGVLAAILVVVERLIASAKADHILNQLTPDEDKKKSEEFTKDLAKATEEIKDADIRYNNAKRSHQPPSDSN